MTQREFYQTVATGTINEEVIAKANELIEKMDAANAARREKVSKKAQEKVVDKAFELASQIENHQYQLLDRSRYFDALNGHIFNYDAASETLTEINIEEELQKRVQKHNDNAN